MGGEIRNKKQYNTMTKHEAIIQQIQENIFLLEGLFDDKESEYGINLHEERDVLSAIEILISSID